MISLAKEIVQSNIDVWGEGFLINAFMVSFALGVVITFFLIKRK
jgi:hypothetical protein